MLRAHIELGIEQVVVGNEMRAAQIEHQHQHSEQHSTQSNENAACRTAFWNVKLHCTVIYLC